MDKNSVLKRNQDLFLVLITYSFLAMVLVSFFQYNVGGDGTSYISIAQHYATGNWQDAVNGYWSPLYSWLIAPFLTYGFDPFQAVLIAKILSLIIGFFTIIGVSRLTSTFQLDGQVKKAILVSTIPMILLFAIRYCTPDLLVTCMLVYYFSIIFDPKYPEKLSKGVSCGFIGAFAYFAKSFVYPFFVIHFILFNLIFYFKRFKSKERRYILKNLLLGLAVFFVISGLWVGTISQKYDKLTIGTAKDYNSEIVGPQNQAHPIYVLGLLKPPNNNAISIWEDPSTIELEDWSALESWQNLEFQFKLVWKNILRTFAFFEKFSLFSVIILVMSLFFIFKVESEKTRDNLIYLLTTILIYSGGYCLIFVEPRYLWPVSILLLITGFYLIENMYKSQIFNSKLKNILLILLMVSFMLTPTYELISYAGADHEIPALSKTLKNNYEIQGNIASNDNWAGTLCISYYLEAKYFGLTKKTDNLTYLENELKANDIDYYFVWNEQNNIILSDYREITGGKIKDLRIYSRLPNNTN